MLNTKKQIIILGGNGTALNIAEAIQDAISNYSYNAELKGFLNDERVGEHIGSFPVIDSLQRIKNYFKPNVYFVFALYKPEKMMERTSLFSGLEIPTTALLNFVHPKAYVAESVRMQHGNIILPYCTVMNNVELGSNNILNVQVVIEHDTVLGSNNFISAAAVIGSQVSIWNSCFIGLNATLRENVVMETNSFLGMGSVLLKNTKENEVWYGVPARRQ